MPDQAANGAEASLAPDAPFTARLQALLREQHGAEVRCHVKPIGSAPAPRAMIEAAARAQVAIAGVAL